MTRQDLGDYIEFALAYVLVGGPIGAVAFLLCYRLDMLLAAILFFPMIIIGGIFSGGVPATFVGIVACALRERIPSCVLRIILSALLGALAAFVWAKLSLPRTYDDLPILERAHAAAGFVGGAAAAIVIECFKATRGNAPDSLQK